MKKFSEQLKRQSENIQFSATEKEALRERLLAFMEYHPAVPVTKPVVKAKQFEPFIEWAISPRLFKQMVAACFVFVVVGVPMLAEKAVPGDVLYAMKVQVNEEVRASLTSGGYEKVVWETKRLERRISEARLLAKEGKLTPEVEAEVIAAVNQHQAETEAQIETLRSTDAEGAILAQMTVASVLDVQAEALKVDAGTQTVALAMALDEAQAHAEQTSGDSLSQTRLVAQLEQETTRGRELLASIKGSATEQEYIDLERRLGDVERKVLSGNSNADGETVLKQAWRDMQVIITFMTDIDVRSALAIETMVPVVLTPEEEKSLAMAAYNEASESLIKIKAVLPTVSEVEVNEKISITVPQVVALLDTASSSMNSDAKAAKLAAEEAREYTRSIVSLASFEEVSQEDLELMMATMPASESISTSTASTTESAVEVSASE